MTSSLAAIAHILATGIGAIELAYTKQGLKFPSLDEPFAPDGFNNEDIQTTTNHVIAAASQLLAMLKPPPAYAVEAAFSHYLTSSLGVVTNANIPEILREGGSQGLHIRDIGERSGTDPQKIGRILRYLATNYFFREISPDVFTNNRLSSVLDTGKTLEAIKADPMAKHDDTVGTVAAVEHNADEVFKTSIHLAENILDPKTGLSEEPLDSPLSRAFGREHGFVIFQRPEFAYRFRRFNVAMHGMSAVTQSDIIVTEFDWKALPKESLVVDVGGGVGSSDLQLAKAFPHLRFVIQDLHTQEQGKEFWAKEHPEALSSGRVKLEVHDFFAPQPIKDASIFFLRWVIHDWPDAFARKILVNLRAAAQTTTKLILMEYLIPYAAPAAQEYDHIPGASVPAAPYPLLANLGNVSNPMLMLDLQMMSFANAVERTIGGFIGLVKGTGWELESIGRKASSPLCLMVFAPIELIA